MKLDHAHIRVIDLDEVVEWFEKFLALRPSYRDAGVAMYQLGEFALLFDRADEAMAVTIGLSSDDCLRDFERLVALGVEPLSEPTDQPYGVRSAYLKGPGELTIEIEQFLPRAA